jgi:hypothetical protein
MNAFRWLLSVLPSFQLNSFGERSRRVAEQQFPDQLDDNAEHRPENSYMPPALTYLGTLRELTLGGVSGPDDGVGGAGGVGSL